MPPLKGVPRGLNGDLLKALEESGHGDQVVVVDPSYPIPEDATVINYQGSPNTSANAVDDLLTIVPIDGDSIGAMLPDDGNPNEATDAFEQVAEKHGMKTKKHRRQDKSESPKHDPGFYTRVKSHELRTIFVRTRDEKAYACAMFVVGHSQEP